jgi:hypothetical protein
MFRCNVDQTVPVVPAAGFAAGVSSLDGKRRRCAEITERASPVFLRAIPISRIEPFDVFAVGARCTETGRAARPEGAVNLEEFREEEEDRPPVENGVVERPQKVIFGAARMDVRESREWSPRRIEGERSLIHDDPPQPLLSHSWGESADIDSPERCIDFAVHALHRSHGSVELEARPQEIVASDDPPPRLFQEPGIRGLVEGEVKLDHVRRGARAMDAVEQHRLLHR